MPNNINWCDYFAAIEKDPAAITPTITVRQFYEAKNHIQECLKCQESTDRVLAKAPDARPMHWEKN